jgi:hypothetical protein
LLQNAPNLPPGIRVVFEVHNQQFPNLHALTHNFIKLKNIAFLICVPKVVIICLMATPPPIIIQKTVTVIIQKFDFFLLKLTTSLVVYPPPPKHKNLDKPGFGSSFNGRQLFPGFGSEF